MAIQHQNLDHATQLDNVGVNDHATIDAQLPTTDQKDALSGTSGAPGVLNPYVTDADARNTDARTPTAHAATHTDGTDNVAVGNGIQIAGSEIRPSYGAAAGTVCEGNDARLSDTRTPTAHTHTAAAGDGGQFSHGNLLNLVAPADDHSQYHTDARGDARYYTKTEHIATSVGAADAGKPVVLDAAGQFDSSMIGAVTAAAHALTHQEGGADEIATTAAAAGAIPKAGVAGTLALGWIPDLSGTYLTGGGTSNYIPRWTAGRVLGDSILQQSVHGIGIGTAPSYSLDILATSGDAVIALDGAGAYPSNAYILFGDGGIFRHTIGFDDVSDILHMVAGSSVTATSGINLNTSNEIGIGANPTSGSKLAVTGETYLNGYLGIGTSTPSDALHVYGSSDASTIKIDESSTGDPTLEWALSGTVKAVAGIDNSVSGDPFVLTYGSGLSDGHFSVASGGRIGMGVSAPSYKLHLSGDGLYYSTVFLNQEGAIYDPEIRFAVGGTAKATLGVDNSDSDSFKIYYGGGLGGNDLVLTSGHRIGIGTSTPATKLHVTGDGSVESQIYLNAEGYYDPAIRFALGGSTEFTMGVDNSDSDNFKIQPYSGLSTSDLGIQLSSSGDVGIGTDPSSNQRLGVVDSKSGQVVFFQNSYGSFAGHGIRVACGANSTGGDHWIIVAYGGDNSTLQGYVKSLGGTMSFVNASDASLKRDIRTYDQDDLSRLRALRVAQWRWEKESDNTTPEHHGWIAQEAQAVIPEIVSALPDSDKLGVAPDLLIPILHRAIQQLADRVETLEQQTLDPNQPLEKT